MEEKKTIKIGLSTFFLILAIIVICIMGYIIYKLNNDNINKTKTVEELQEKIDLIANIPSNNSDTNLNISENSNSTVNTIKPTRKISKIFKNYDEAENYIVNSTNPDEFYANEILIGDAILSGLEAEYTVSSTHQKDSTDYEVNNLNDLFTENCWCEGSSGKGIGETIEINAFPTCEKVEWGSSKRNMKSFEDVIDYLLSDFNSEPGRVETKTITKDNISNYYSELNQIAIINGYAKNDALWKNNNRIKKLKLTIDNNKEYILELEDTMDLQLFDINYKNNCITNKINLKFEILEVYSGEKYDDTCLTSLYLSGGSNIQWGGR